MSRRWRKSSEYGDARPDAPRVLGIARLCRVAILVGVILAFAGFSGES
jgi:hypothetical protein